MKLSSKRRSLKQYVHKCKCGWMGFQQQLAFWLREDSVVSRICPSCGTRVAQNKVALSQKLNTSRRVLH